MREGGELGGGPSLTSKMLKKMALIMVTIELVLWPRGHTICTYIVAAENQAGIFFDDGISMGGANPNPNYYPQELKLY